MINLNRYEIIGNLTRDPELRYTPNGQAVASFAVATNRRYKDKNNTWVDSPPEYHDVVVWGKLGEGVNQVLKKGMRIFIAGRLQTRSWDAPDGSKRYKTELIADTLIGPDQINKAAYSGEFSAPAMASAGSSQNQPISEEKPALKNTNQNQNSAPTSTASTDEEINIEDIPF